MNGSRLNSNPSGERSSLDALNRTIEGLEARIEGLLKASGREKRTAADRLADANHRVEVQAPAPAPRRGNPDLDALNEIRQRQRMLEGRDRDARRPLAEMAPQDRRLPEPPPVAPRIAEPRRMPVEPAISRDTYSEPPRRAPLQREPDVRDVAQALQDLRRELKHDISSSIAHEMNTLRSELTSFGELSKNRDLTHELREELVRLAHGVDGLSRRAPSGASEVRAELDDLRRLIDGLATADSVHRMEARWSELEDRFQDLDTAGIQKELIALAYRIDGVKAELGTMADSPAIRALEDKILTLAGLVEELNARPQQQDDLFADQFSHLDQRLDEISRAVAAGARTRGMDSEEQAALRRLEDRLTSLTDRIASLAHMQDAQRLEERLDELAAHMGQMPSADLTGYIADLSRKIDALAHEQTSEGLGERLDELNRRIDDLGRHSSMSVPADDAGLERLEVRLDEIAARLDEAARGPQGDNQAIINLERQIAHLSGLLSEPRPDMAAALPGGLDQRIASIESYMATSDEYILEAARHAAEAVIENYARSPREAGAAGPDTAQLVGLAEDLRHLEELARSSEERTHAAFDGVHRTLVKIAERLDKMEDHMTVRGGSLLGSTAAAPKAHVAAGDIRPPLVAPSAPVERATASRTTEDILAESTANIDLLSPAFAEPVDTADEKSGLLAGLKHRLRPKPKAEAPRPSRSVVEPAPSIDPTDVLPSEHENDLLEPGSGMPDVRKILERVRATQAANPAAQSADGERVDYIAAARRAAKAAAQETDPLHTLVKDKTTTRTKGKVAPPASGLKGALGRHRRPILMAVGAILLALMAMPLVSTLTRGDKPVPATVSTSNQTSSKLDAPKTAVAQTATSETPVVAATTASAPAEPEQAPVAAPETAQTEPPQAEPVPEELAKAPASSESSETAAAAPAMADAIKVPATITPKSLSDAAAKGDPQALFEIGARFTEGRGVTADPKEAARWYELAAERGFAPAQYRLGSLYEKGTGVERDMAKAMALYEEAARAGNASSMHNLAVLYASGATGSANYKAAVEWFTKAADHGITDSQFNLAILYARGNGTAQNLEESYKWFAVAAKEGDKDAAQKRDEVANALKPEQLQSAKAKAEMWKPQPLDDRANSVNLPDEWVSKGQTTASIDMEKAIRNIQAILNKRGYDAGQPDGMMGKKTITAIKEFQKKNGLPEDGNITEPLVRKLLEENQAKGA
ncbi:peptidoglycan-binding protein [Rhizobium sp. SL86]|uniref:peptidoglycan-binding protein n=1 Tax=Rhizobium sp. SL86 TaxID=2995148 RepID=UPI002272F6B2|nr:peptidoglycan-binding protein [Rhizobium sp. SL86]MCY1664787.1 peptidoglycan-binding protein [Rhizobium sp. SL86]